METNGLIVSAIYGAVTLILATQIHSRIPSPYMDEIFHVPQAQKYCLGNFKEVSKFIKVKYVCKIGHWWRSWSCITRLWSLSLCQHPIAYVRRRIVGCRLPGTGVYVYIVAESDDVISELKTELTQDSRNALSAGSAVTQNLEIPRNWEQNETTFYYVITFSHECNSSRLYTVRVQSVKFVHQYYRFSEKICQYIEFRAGIGLKRMIW